MSDTLIEFKSISSTNTWTKDNIDTLSQSHLTLITAEEQTAGRGRYQREWFSPKGKNIYMTVHGCVSLEKNLSNACQVMASSVLMVLNSIHISLQIKWPNDLLINGKKIGGILAESIQKKDKQHLVIGLGLNINSTVDDLANIGQAAGSLLIETEKEWDIKELTQLIFRQFKADFNLWQSEGARSMIQCLNDNIAPCTKYYSFYDGKQTYQASSYTFNEDGSLSLHLVNGHIKQFFSGDLSLAG